MGHSGFLVWNGISHIWRSNVTSQGDLFSLSASNALLDELEEESTTRATISRRNDISKSGAPRNEQVKWLSSLPYVKPRK